MPAESVQCCVTSPPYYGLRDYGQPGQIGLEESPAAYVSKMVEVFEEVRRVLKPDGTLWLNLGDSYAGSWGAQSRGGPPSDKSTLKGNGHVGGGPKIKSLSAVQIAAHPHGTHTGSIPKGSGLKAKDLIGIPWRVAFALQAAGWWLREDIIWAKPNCMPESVTDRCTRSHEYLFHFAKSAKYYHDAEAIKEPCIYDIEKRIGQPNFDNQGGGEKDGLNPNRSHRKVLENLKAKADKQRGHSRRHDGFNDRWDKMEKEEQCSGMRNKRSVWNVAPANYPKAHFATFPPKLIEPCILAGSRAGDVVLDPFGGSGTTGQVAIENGRLAWLIELNPDYCALIRQRCAITPGLALTA